MSSAQHVLEKLQRVLSVKEAEIDSIIARSEQHFKYAGDINGGLAEFVDNLLGVETSTLNERAMALENEHSQACARVKEMIQKIACVMEDVKCKCNDV